MPPQVRDLQTLIAQQTSALKPQSDLLDTSITANDASGTAQAAGLDATKDNSFKGIVQNAQDKGMAFSGFTPDEEAKYTAGTYLPALAQLQSTIASTRSSLLGKKADLNTSAYDKATAQQEGDIAASRAYQDEQAKEQFQAAQADKDRAAQAALHAQDNAAAARLAAAKPAPAVTGYGVASQANNGGLAFHGPNGQPISAGAYLDAISGGSAGVKDLAQVLSGSNSASDKKIAASIGNMSLSQAQKAYPWLFQ